jgi:anti-anti-sigma factor
MLLNFERLSYINSIGLRVILVVSKQLNRSDGQLCICSLNEPVREVFDITGFSTILNVVDTEPEALNAF